MAFSISEIYSNISRAGGIAKPNLFSVIINPPAWSSSQTAPRLIQFMADTAQLPGITFATNDVKNNGYGPTFKLPHTPIYTDLDLTIMMDNNGVILEFFHRWMQNIININPEGSPGTSAYNGAKMYAVQYPSNYVTTITITLYNSSSEEIVVYTLNDAYPLRVGQPGLDWAATNAALRLPVTFTYRTWSATTFHKNGQTIDNTISSFNPFARTLTEESLYNPTTNLYYTPGDVFNQTAISLINNDGLSLNLFF